MINFIKTFYYGGNKMTKTFKGFVFANKERVAEVFESDEESFRKTGGVNSSSDKYTEDSALLIVEKGHAPILILHGKSYSITQLSYQYITSTATMLGSNRIVAQYIDGNVAKEIMIDNQNGNITYGNQWGNDHAES